jgi:thiamine pyrophosphokinase
VNEEHTLYDLLICNGDLLTLPRSGRLAQGAHSIVCADGGANQARRHGFVPDTIIGDFDSITPETRTHYKGLGTEFVHLDRQDDTDFEKALKLLRKRRCETLVILGLTGGALDHTLGNLSILQRYTGAMDIVIFNEDFRIDIVTETTVFSATPDTRVSIIPLQPARGVSYQGLLYDLPNSKLVNGENEGTCNRATEETFTVSLDSGMLMVMRELTDELLEVQ